MEEEREGEGERREKGRGKEECEGGRKRGKEESIVEGRL